MNNFTTLLSEITVDCKDNGVRFKKKKRIKAIETWLADTDYTLLYEGDLALIYGKKPLSAETRVVISSHIDCVYSGLFCEELSEALWKGTFDNSLTNAAVIQNMRDNLFADDVVIAFTGDEEDGQQGAIEVMEEMKEAGCTPQLVIVSEVTEEGWEEDANFTIENDLQIDLKKAHKLINLLEPYNYQFIHQAEPDESWSYGKMEHPCLTLSIPVLGEMHGKEGVVARKKDLPIYCEALALLANKA
ncbi:MAG: M28 family peptidase [Phocaeicola sp.]